MPGSSRSGHQIAVTACGIVDAGNGYREGGPMRSQKISQGFAMTTAAAAAALLLTACGPSQPQSQTTTAPGTGQASQSPTSSASTAPPASSAPATTTASPAPGTTGAGAPALCKAAGLTA